MASDSHKSFLQIFIRSFSECYPGKEREVALEKSPFILGVVRRGGLPSKRDTDHHRDGQRRLPPGPAGAGRPPSDQGNLKNQRPVMVESPKGPGCLGVKNFLGWRTFMVNLAMSQANWPCCRSMWCIGVQDRARHEPGGKPFSRGLPGCSLAEACIPWPSCPCKTMSLHFAP